MSQIFRLYKDTKQTIWTRDIFNIEAESLEEAVKMLASDNIPEGCFEESETLHGTAEEMEIGDNNGDPTKEIWEEDKNLWDNVEGLKL